MSLTVRKRGVPGSTQGKRGWSGSEVGDVDERPNSLTSDICCRSRGSGRSKTNPNRLCSGVSRTPPTFLFVQPYKLGGEGVWTERYVTDMGHNFRRERHVGIGRKILSTRKIRWRYLRSRIHGGERKSPRSLDRYGNFYQGNN